MVLADLSVVQAMDYEDLIKIHLNTRSNISLFGLSNRDFNGHLGLPVERHAQLRLPSGYHNNIAIISAMYIQDPA